MRSFQFKLEKVLQVRQLQEDLQREAFWEVQQDLDDARECLRSLQQEFARYRERLRSCGRKEAEVHEVLSYERYIDYLHAAIERQLQVMAGLEAQLEEQRKALQEAARRREVLERLKERQKEVYRKYRNRILQNLLDEVGQKRRGPTEGSGM
ncbi:MAG TPA: flagellar export protein FliJ [Candidatus Latescibacteria bacterium]|nr:flagellar export protein FliJ [Candidatus Latescibacterota bacterium]